MAFFTTEAETRAWLNQQGVQNYTITSEYFVDVVGDVDISNRGLTDIPVQFTTITGDFNCNHNNLEYTIGFPTNVGGSLDCSYNKLVTFTPSIINSLVSVDFNCSYNMLTALDGCPSHVHNLYCQHNKIADLTAVSMMSLINNFICSHNLVGSLVPLAGLSFTGDFMCDNNKLVGDIIGGPGVVNGSYDLSYNYITSIPNMNISVVGANINFSHNNIKIYECTASVGQDIIISHNKLINLNGMPSAITGSLDCSYNDISELGKGAPSSIGQNFVCSYNRLTNLFSNGTSIGGCYLCDHNQLNSLEGCASNVPGDFDCSYNFIGSVTTYPLPSVGGNLNCSNNRISDLSAYYIDVAGSFDCSYNQIVALNFNPTPTTPFSGNLNCSHNKISTTSGFPPTLHNSLNCSYNLLTDISALIFSGYVIEEINISHNQIAYLPYNLHPRLYGDFMASHNIISGGNYAPEFILGEIDLSYNSYTALPSLLASTSLSANLSTRPKKINISHNQITSLQGIELPNLPFGVIGDFDCSYNQLNTSLYHPSIVGGVFNCCHNNLSRIDDLSDMSVYGGLDCSFNSALSIIVAFPVISKGNINCSNCSISALNTNIFKLDGSLDCSHNYLALLTGLPEEITGSLNCSYNNITLLDNTIYSVGGGINLSDNQNLYCISYSPVNKGARILLNNTLFQSTFTKLGIYKQVMDNLDEFIRLAVVTPELYIYHSKYLLFCEMYGLTAITDYTTFANLVVVYGYTTIL
jgi:hypothetical protein